MIRPPSTAPTGELRVEGMMTQRFAPLRTSLLPCLVLPCVMLALAGCGHRDVPLPDETLSALETAFNRDDIIACADVYADDAEIIPDDGPVVRGRQAIIEYFKGQVARAISFDTDTTLSIVKDDLAIEQGTYRVRDVHRGINVEYGEYLNVWRKTNGKWRAFRSMFTSTMAPRADVSVSAESEVPPTTESQPKPR
jgi:ketosteroid isomerase-like protein